MRKWNVAVLGATGAVGRVMIQVLEEKQLPIVLYPLASKRSAGKQIQYLGELLTIQEATPDTMKNMDIVLSAVENDVSLYLTPFAVQAGALVIDNSSAFRLDADVPLVIPEVNAQDIAQHNGIIANPNCSTIIAMVAVQALHRYASIDSMVVSTYQAVSGAGVEGIDELDQQVKAHTENEPLIHSVFPYPIAFNLIPQIGTFTENGYSSEEMKMQNEGRKILHAPNMLVNCTCVRIPVFTSHSESITLSFDRPVSVETAKTLLASAPGITLADDLATQMYPMPLLASNQDQVLVGRIREDITNPGYGITLWCCGDQLRKGAATNAVQIAEAWMKDNSFSA